MIDELLTNKLNQFYSLSCWNLLKYMNIYSSVFCWTLKSSTNP